MTGSADYRVDAFSRELTLSPSQQDPNKTVTVVGGGVAGMSAACALAEAGFRVQLVERRSYLGGRASSYLHPGVGEVIDNCQHVLFGCCTNLIGFYKRIGVAERIHWTSEMTMIEPGGRRSLLGPSWLPAPLHGLPKLLAAKPFTLADKLALARAFSVLMRPVPPDSTESLGEWLKRNRQTQGALDRFWRLVIASALNADLDCIALPYAAKVIRELFMNSAQAGSMGMSTRSAKRTLRGRGGVSGAARFDAFTSTPMSSRQSSTKRLRNGSLVASTGNCTSDFLVLALPFEATAKLIPHMPPAEGAEAQPADRAPRALAHLQRASVVRSRDHHARPCRAARPRASLDVQQEPPATVAQVKGSYLELVVSASRSLPPSRASRPSPRPSASWRSSFPAAASAKLEKAALVKEVRATFGVPPGIDSARPPASVAVAQLLSRRRLDRNRLALDDGERRALRPSCGRGRLPRHRRAAAHSSIRI